MVAVTGLTPRGQKPMFPEIGDVYFDRELNSPMVFSHDRTWHMLAPTGTGTIEPARERLTRLDAYGCCLTCGAPHDGGQRCRHCRNVIYL